MPVMLNFHGFGGTSERHLRNADMRSLSESKGFILIYPQATQDDYGNPTWHLGAENSKSTSVDDVGYIEHIIQSKNNSV